MSSETDQLSDRANRLFLPPPLWPEKDRSIWLRSRLGRGPEGRDNLAFGWSPRTLKNTQDAYGRYLSWLSAEGMLNEDEPIAQRITPARITSYWVDRWGNPMSEESLRELVKRCTRKGFGAHLWPHLFRDCLMTSVAIDDPDLVRASAALLGHASYKTGEKHYNQAQTLNASRRFGGTIENLRQRFLEGTSE